MGKYNKKSLQQGMEEESEPAHKDLCLDILEEENKLEEFSRFK